MRILIIALLLAACANEQASKPTPRVTLDCYCFEAKPDLQGGEVATGSAAGLESSSGAALPAARSSRAPAPIGEDLGI